MSSLVTSVIEPATAYPTIKVTKSREDWKDTEDCNPIISDNDSLKDSEYKLVPMNTYGMANHDNFLRGLVSYDDDPCSSQQLEWN